MQKLKMIRSFAVVAAVAAALSACSSMSATTADTKAVSATVGAPFDFGAPLSRDLNLYITYTAADPTRSAVITISPVCNPPPGLAIPAACVLEAHISPNGHVVCTDPVVATWTDQFLNGVPLIHSFGSPGTIHLPINWSFAVCQKTGTGAVIQQATDQPAG